MTLLLPVLMIAATFPGDAAPHPQRAAYSPAAAVPPGAVGELDCNGLSQIQRPAKANMVCADPRGPYGGRFYDHGHYIGHDEPSVRFLSSRPGSGNNFSITETPPAPTTVTTTARRTGRTGRAR